MRDSRRSCTAAITGMVAVIILTAYFGSKLFHSQRGITRERLAELQYGIDNKVSGVIYCHRFRDRPSKYFTNHIERYDPKLGVVTVTGVVEGFSCEFVKNGAFSKFGFDKG